MVAGRMHFGGLETMLMNFFRHMDREKVVFDFMLNYKEPGAYDEEILSLGGRIYIMPRLYFKNLFRYISEVNRFFKEHHNDYDTVHGNLTSAGVIYLTIAKLRGIKTRIIHAHYASVRRTFKGFVERLMIFPVRYCADYNLACSEAAARFCFGKKTVRKRNYILIKNGINPDLFVYNPAIRKKKRAELGITDEFVVGHIGRFNPEKNHSFILRVFCELLKTEPKAILLLVGDGPLRDEISYRTETLGISEKVIILNERPDVNELMQAMDAFILPSLYEGLPVVGVEAQAAGLRCFLSENITREVDITGLCSFLPLCNPEIWAESILNSKDYIREDNRVRIRRAGYDVAEQARKLQSFYLGETKLENRKKTVHIIQALKTGGAEMLLSELAKNCAAEYDVYVISLYKDHDKYFDDFLKSAGVSVFYLDKRVGFSIKSTIELWKLLTYINPDIIHTHLEAAVYAIPYYIFNRSNTRVHTIHSKPKHEFTKYHIFAMKLAYRYLKVTPVAISHSLQQEAAALYSRAPDKIPVIYNGIHTAKYAVDKAEKSNPDEIRLINVASFSEIKNHRLLLNAFSLISEKHPTATLTLVGDGALRESIEKLAEEYGFSESTVRFMGVRNDIPRLLSNADIFVLSSLYEVVPLVILEAYAAGLPVVATSVGGVPDILIDGENGSLVPSDDASAFAEAVLKLAENPELYNTISRNNTQKASAFDISVIAEQYKTLYERDTRHNGACSNYSKKG